MIPDVPARQYVSMLKAHVAQCACIAPEERTRVPARPSEDGNLWIVVRGLRGLGELFMDDPDVAAPFQLTFGGAMELEVRIRERRVGNRARAEVAAYRFLVQDLPDNPNSLRCFRYDKSEGQPRGVGWENELGDNPQHPWAHLHVNFAATSEANHCRMPTAPVCPLLLLRAFDYWYCTTFGS